MPIWGCPMIRRHRAPDPVSGPPRLLFKEVPEQVRDTAILACASLALSWTAASAETAWEMFVARCLDPYENQALAIHDGLPEQPAEQMRDGETVFGPSPEGYLMVINAAPIEGERTCSVRDPGAEGPDPGYLVWIDKAMARQTYVPLDGMLSSNEWIEPQLQFEARFGAGGAVYEIIETELES